MYARPSDRVDDAGDALQLLEAAPFVHLVSMSSAGFEATSIPMLLDRDAGRLLGHVARANVHWTSLDDQPVLVIALPSEGYVSPDWYPSKQETGGRVVPTWNYEAVHVRGTARVHHDPTWLEGLVERLTDTHESRRTDGGQRWGIGDAPADFLEQQLRAIVGVSVSIDSIDAKRKLGANRSVADRAGVVAGLSRTIDASPRLVRVTSMRAPSDHQRP